MNTLFAANNSDTLQRRRNSKKLWSVDGCCIQGTHWFRFSGQVGGLRKWSCIFPGSSVAAAAAISGQVLSTDGQNLTVVKTHLTSPAHRSLISLRSTLCPQIALVSSLSLFVSPWQEFLKKSLLTLAHSQFAFTPNALRRWDQRHFA